MNSVDRPNEFGVPGMCNSLYYIVSIHVSRVALAHGLGGIDDILYSLIPLHVSRVALAHGSGRMFEFIVA